jgi:hypothetical protein
VSARWVRWISAPEPTAHNDADIPPERPMRPEYEPYTTAVPNDTLALPPFFVALCSFYDLSVHSDDRANSPKI